MPLTKIICTIGPASQEPEKLKALLEAGMGIARVNIAHGSEEQRRGLLQSVQNVSALSGRPIATLLDVKGPEIRTADRDEPLEVQQGDIVIFAPSYGTADGKTVCVNYDAFAKDVRGCTQILVDGGALVFEVKQISGNEVHATAMTNGSITSRRHVNVPGAHISLPSVTEKDWHAIAMGIEEQVDFVAVSFVRSAADIELVRARLHEKSSSMKIIAKIETQQAVEHIAAIIDASDGIMVARGDLGVELPFESIPALQDDIVRLCRRTGKPVIVATHMLESMIDHPLPTRAEVTDVAHAASTYTDAVMLSGETATGQYPIRSVQAMSRILEETERARPSLSLDEHACVHDEREARVHAALSMANALDCPAIFVCTRSGKTATALSMLRPRVPLYAFTPAEYIQRQLQLFFGIRPYCIPFSDDPEETVTAALACIREEGVFPQGTRIVFVSDAKVSSGLVSSVQVRSV